MGKKHIHLNGLGSNNPEFAGSCPFDGSDLIVPVLRGNRRHVQGRLFFFFFFTYLPVLKTYSAFIYIYICYITFNIMTA